MVGLTSLRTRIPPMLPKLNPKRALFVLTKIDEILAWERRSEAERDTRFVELGAGRRHWRRHRRPSKEPHLRGRSLLVPRFTPVGAASEKLEVRVEESSPSSPAKLLSLSVGNGWERRWTCVPSPHYFLATPQCGSRRRSSFCCARPDTLLLLVLHDSFRR